MKFHRGGGTESGTEKGIDDMRWMTILLVLCLCGCSITQVRQEFIGLTASDVKDSKTKQTEQYDISSDKCLAEIREVLKKMDAIVRENRRKKFIVADNFQNAFPSCIDTTQVGILVTPLQADKTQVDVASGNVDLAIFVSKRILNKIKPEKVQPTEEEQKIIK